MQAEEIERRRIARILHDELQQLLVAARYALDPVRTSVADPSSKETLNRVDAAIAEGLAVSRSLTTELSPPVRGSGPLVPVLQWLALQMKHRHGLSVVVHDAGESAWKSETLLILLYQAVRELLFNVVKHAKVKTAVVKVKEKDGGVQVEVADNGLGFDPAKMEQGRRISAAMGFSRSGSVWRTSAAGWRYEAPPGPAVGLPCGSRPGRSGNRSGPRTRERPQPRPRRNSRPVPIEAAGPPEPAGPPTRPRTRRIRVLLADDHPVVRRGLALSLKDQPDIEVVAEAQTGREAVEKSSQVSPDVIVMDMRMPDLGGIEATRIIHDRLPTVPGHRLLGVGGRGPGGGHAGGGRGRLRREERLSRQAPRNHPRLLRGPGD